MNIFQSSLFAIAIGYCLLCAFGLRNLLPQWQLRYFSLFLFLEAMGFGFEWLMLHPGTGFKALWLGGLMQLSLLIAPCLWLCTLEITQQQTPSVSALPKLHKGLLLVSSFCLLPLLLSAHSGNQFGNSVPPVSQFQVVFIHTSMLVAIGIFALQVPMLIIRIRRLLQNHEQQIENRFSNLQKYSLKALNWLLLILLVKWLMAIMRTLHCMYIGPVGGLGINLFMTIEILVTLRALFALSRLTPQPFIQGSRTDENLQADEQSNQETLGKNSPEKYANSPLDDNIRQRIQTKLRNLMEEQKVYIQPGLSLKQISEQLNESQHYLSQVINRNLQCSFYEWVNRYRIEAAKQALVDYPEKTILGIAEEVGFNSKSTFNTAFRHYTQMTPSEYRQQKPK